MWEPGDLETWKPRRLETKRPGDVKIYISSHTRSLYKVINNDVLDGSRGILIAFSNIWNELGETLVRLLTFKLRSISSHLDELSVNQSQTKRNLIRISPKQSRSHLDEF